MTECRRCNASIIWGTTPDGQPVALDARQTAMTGPNRYRIQIQAGGTVAQPLSEEYPAEGNLDHATICQEPRPIG